MKKMRKISLLLCFTLILTSYLPVLAKHTTSGFLDHVDVYLNGSVKIESQINGVTQNIKTGILEISNLTATIVENNTSRTYTNFSKQMQANTSRELEFHKQVQYYTTAATITISGTMKCKELKLNTSFSKTFSETDLIAANSECPAHSGCDFRITDSEINNIITHNVIFKTETRGYINSGTSDISYTNIVDASKFPEIPSVKAADENYTFAGWFDELGNPITVFPETVTKNYVFTAKWNKEIIPSSTPVATPKPTYKPTTSKKPKYQVSDYVPVTGENNIIFYIIAIFLISVAGIILILKHKKH